MHRQTSVQKGRFTVMDDDGNGGGGGGGSTIVGASEPDPGAVAAAAKAAAAAERDLDPPRLKVRGMYEAMEAAAEHAKMLRKMHEHMEEQQAEPGLSTIYYTPPRVKPRLPCLLVLSFTLSPRFILHHGKTKITTR